MNEQRCDGCGQQDVPPPWAFVSLAVAIWRGRRIFLWARTAFAVPWFWFARCRWRPGWIEGHEVAFNVVMNEDFLGWLCRGKRLIKW